MTREEKELLLKDLCARLPYKVKLQYFGKIPNYFIRKLTEDDLILTLSVDNFSYIEKTIVYYKPYLRSIDTMTEEERAEYGLVLCDELSINQFDWLNAHHFDYRGLIEKGLALEAPEDMYNKLDDKL